MAGTDATDADEPPDAQKLPPGLYFVATPIGAADDISLRALKVLAHAEVLAAEDTRRARKLLDLHAIPLSGRPLIAYHDHNGPAQRPRLLAALAQGARVAYVSDAGTPLIADPGFRLAQAATAAGHTVFAVPGASAVLAALTVAGLPADRFYFGGFLPPKSAARRKRLASLAALDATLVFYEAPHRVAATLEDMAQTLAPDRAAVLCRELTKRFEQTRRMQLGALAATLAGEAAPKGECVILIGPPAARQIEDADIDAALDVALRDVGVREASIKLSQTLGVARKRVYERALDHPARRSFDPGKGQDPDAT